MDPDPASSNHETHTFMYSFMQPTANMELIEKRDATEFAENALPTLAAEPMDATPATHPTAMTENTEKKDANDHGAT